MHEDCFVLQQTIHEIILILLGEVSLIHFFCIDLITFSVHLYSLLPLPRRQPTADRVIIYGMHVHVTFIFSFLICLFLFNDIVASLQYDTVFHFKTFSALRS